MKRTTAGVNGNGRRALASASPDVLLQVVTDVLSRTGLARRMGFSYGDKRKLYQALGYPTETDLTFEYYYNKYDRNAFAAAVIDRPVDKTWSGGLTIVEPGKKVEDSALSKAWIELNKKFKVKKRLNKVDKLCMIGRFSLLLFGFDDVKKVEDFLSPVNGTRKLMYLRQVAESEVSVDAWENNTSSDRYGQPLIYRIKVGTVQSIGGTINATVTSSSMKEISVHHSRVIHIVANNLTNETVGEPYLKKNINNLIDIEKILGGDAEMFWRGARPGYQAKEDENYELDTQAKADLNEELDKYEHDLRRFIVARGVDITKLETQVADPMNHVDIQLQAISGRTGIPKRVLIGAERGELASSQDKDQWLNLIKTRQEEYAEPDIYRPFVDKCMEHGILPKVEYAVMWEDVFAPSESEKVEVGAKRAKSLKDYSDASMGSDILAPKLVFKHLLGMNEEQVAEAMTLMDEESIEEDKLLRKAAAEGAIDSHEEEDDKPEPQPVKRKRTT